MADDSRSVTVQTGARLHFGLFDTRAPFGGVGVMINEPETIVRVSTADAFDAGMVESQRLRDIAARLGRSAFAGRFSDDLPPCQIRVQCQAPAHSGFGSGTQLSLAAATALVHFWDLRIERSELIQQIAGRGRRSAIGSIGFFEGGMILEDGVSGDYDNPMRWRRVDPPSEWRFLVVRPTVPGATVSGEAEGNAFAALPPSPPERRERLTRLGGEIIDACQGGDFAAFAERLTRFNQASGMLFEPMQGGCYNGPVVADLVRNVVAAGAVAYGQSSWGPSVFVVCRCESSAAEIADRLGKESSVQVTSVRHTGPTVTLQ
jgi:beta-ribofuranosylaminobenzene 5'-phosphate synthase